MLQQLAAGTSAATEGAARRGLEEYNRQVQPVFNAFAGRILGCGANCTGNAVCAAIMVKYFGAPCLRCGQTAEEVGDRHKLELTSTGMMGGISRRRFTKVEKLVRLLLGLQQGPSRA
jgi:hypothetical protein